MKDLSSTMSVYSNNRVQQIPTANFRINVFHLHCLLIVFRFDFIVFVRVCVLPDNNSIWFKIVALSPPVSMHMCALISKQKCASTFLNSLF